MGAVFVNGNAASSVNFGGFNGAIRRSHDFRAVHPSCGKDLSWAVARKGSAPWSPWAIATAWGPYRKPIPACLTGA